MDGTYAGGVVKISKRRAQKTCSGEKERDAHF